MISMLYVLLILLIIYLLFYFIQKNSSMIYVQSSKDKRFYLVRKVNDIKEEENAANILALVNEKILSLIEYINNKEPQHKGFQRLKQKYNPNKLNEIPVNKKDIAFSINKGQELHLCIRKDISGGPFTENINDIIIVMIHEISHIATKSFGHTKEFWDNYNLIKKLAIESNIYIESKSTQVCGKNI